MRRIAVVAVLSLLLVLAVPPPGAHAMRIKHITAPEGVFLGAGGIIERELVAVRSSYFKKPGRYVLVPRLVERRQSGAEVLLGEQSIPFGALNVVLEDDGDGRPVVEVAWSTTQILGSSLIDACATVIKLAKNRDVVVSDQDCRTFDPSL